MANFPIFIFALILSVLVSIMTEQKFEMKIELGEPKGLPEMPRYNILIANLTEEFEKFSDGSKELIFGPSVKNKLKSSSLEVKLTSSFPIIITNRDVFGKSDKILIAFRCLFLGHRNDAVLTLKCFLTPLDEPVFFSFADINNNDINSATFWIGEVSGFKGGFCKNNTCDEEQKFTFQQLLDLPGSTPDVNPFGVNPEGLKFFRVTFLFNANDFDGMVFTLNRRNTLAQTMIPPTTGIIPQFLGVSSNVNYKIEEALSTIPRKVTFGAYSSDLDIDTLTASPDNKRLSCPQSVLQLIGTSTCEFTSDAIIETPEDELPFGNNFCL